MNTSPSPERSHLIATVRRVNNGAYTLTDICPTSGSPLIDAIDTITARFERPRLAVVTNQPVEPRDPKKWRKAYNRFLRHQLEEIRCQRH